MIVSVVIAVFNREDLIEQCVRSVLDQTFKENYEIIVVDDASTDKTPQLLSKILDPKLTVLRNEKNRGPSYSRNRAVGQSKGEYIVFLDADCIAGREWAQEIIKPFELDSRIVIVSGKIIDPPPKTYWEIVNEGINFIASSDGYTKDAYTCNMAVRSDYMQKNLFDETLPFSEDIDFSLRCLRNNYKIYYTSRATLVHFHRSTFRRTIRSYFNWGTYNTLVRLRWNDFPFLNYGTFLLLGTLFSLLLGLGKIAGAIFLFYLVSLLCLGVRPGGKSLLNLIISYPAGVVVSLVLSAGNLWGVILFVRTRFSGHSRI